MAILLLILFIILSVISWLSFLAAKGSRKILPQNDYTTLWQIVTFIISFAALAFLTFIIIINSISLER